MGDLCPFHSAFAGAAAGDAFASSSPRRVEGFDAVASSADLPRACSLTDGVLTMQLSRHQSREPPPGPRLTVQTKRGWRVGLRSMRVPISIQENAAELGRAGSSEPGLLLGPIQPGQPTHRAAGMARACSGNIDMPTRLSKAQTAPEGLPSSLVLAALASARDSGPLGHSQSGGASPAAAIGMLCAGPQQQQVQPPAAPQLATGRSGSGGAASSRPPMPLTPVAAVSAARSHPHSRLQRQHSGAYRELFDAQTEASMAQAQVTGLQEALRRKDEEVEALKQELLLVSAERNMLRELVGPAGRNTAAASPYFQPSDSVSDLPPAVDVLAADDRTVPQPAAELAGPAVVAAPPGLRLPASGAVLKAVALGPRATAGPGAAAGLQQRRQMAQPLAADTSVPTAAAEEAEAACSGMASAFASRARSRSGSATPQPGSPEISSDNKLAPAVALPGVERLPWLHTAASGVTAPMSDCFSPFAACTLQQQGAGTPPAAVSMPKGSSRSSSPMRVVGFDSSPTSVVALRRWQSALEAATLAAMEAAAKAEGHGGDASVTVSTPDPPMGFGRAPKSLPLAPRPTLISRQSSLGTLLKQQEQLAALHSRLSINTGRTTTPAARPPNNTGRAQAASRAAGSPGAGPPTGAVPSRAVGTCAGAAAAQGLEQSWMEALTPGSNDMQHAAATCAPVTTPATAHAVAPPTTATSPPLDNPFAAAAHLDFDSQEEAEEEQAARAAPAGALPPSGRGRRGARPPSRGRPPPPPLTAQGRGSAALGLLRPGCGITRQGSTSASISIPFRRMRRAETAPALTDDIIAAAVAATEASTSCAAACKVAAAAAAATSTGSSCANSPLKSGSGPILRPVAEQQATAARDVFEAQAEAVAAQAQAHVLQLALAQERQRADQLQRQMRYMLRERAEEKAAQQKQGEWLEAQQQLLAQQQEQLLAMHQQHAEQQQRQSRHKLQAPPAMSNNSLNGRGQDGVPLLAGHQSALRSHLVLDHEDPSVADKFTVSRLRRARGGRGRGVPSAVHGAPLDAEESRETLGRLKRMAGFEAQDFDPAENDIQREFAVHRSEHDYATAETWKWLLSILIGAVMGVLAFLVDWGIESMNGFKFAAVRASVADSGGFVTPYLTHVGISLMFALVAGGLISFVEPLAAGSGIPEVKTYLNGVHIKGLLTIRTLVTKLSGITFSIAAGLIAGKEGPFVHGGGIVGGGIGGMGSQSLSEWLPGRREVKAPRALGGYFRNAADHRDFTAIGTAAGVATAFAAPIGGLLFCIEEGVSFYSTSIFWRGFLATCVGVLTLHILADAKDHPGRLMATKFGRLRDFGLYNDNYAAYGSRMFYHVWDVPLFCCVGALGGLLGALFIHLNVRITQFRHRHIPFRSSWKRLAEVVCLSFVTASIWFCMAWSGPCHPLPSPDDLQYLEADDDKNLDFLAGGGEAPINALEHFPRLWCPNGTYSAHGQIFLVPLSQALRLLMHLGEPLPETRPAWEFPLAATFAFFILCFSIMCWTNGVGASTGMFVPSLAVGAAGGRLVGRLVAWAVHSAGSKLPVSLNAYSVIGAAAFLGGSTRMTMTTTVMVMETTGALQLIIVGDRYGVGIDDTHVRLRGAPVLDEPSLDVHQQMIDDKLSASELMTTSLIALPPVVPVRRLIDTLRMCNHQAFPVTPEVEKALDASNEPFALHGVILRSTLLYLLRSRRGFTDPRDTARLPGRHPRASSSELSEGGGGGGGGGGFRGGPGGAVLSNGSMDYAAAAAAQHFDERQHVPRSQAERLLAVEEMQQIPIKIRVREELEAIVSALAPSDFDALLDLRPFMQRAPFVVNEDSSLGRGYRLFRTMGLRHMFVGPPHPLVAGMLTRKDIITDNARLALGRKANLGLVDSSEARLLRRTLPFMRAHLGCRLTKETAMPACCQPSLPPSLLLLRRAARRQRQQLAPTCPKPSRSGGGEGRLS
ncbi:Chloride channel protein A [Chlorella vulgaris]